MSSSAVRSSGRQRSQQALLSGQQAGTQAATQGSASFGHVKLARAPVIGVDLSLDKALPFQFVDHLAKIDRIDAHAFRHLFLASTRLLQHGREHAEEQRRQTFAIQNLGRDAKADLIEAARQMRRHAMRRQNFWRNMRFCHDHKAKNSNNKNYYYMPKRPDINTKIRYTFAVL